MRVGVAAYLASSLALAASLFSCLRTGRFTLAFAFRLLFVLLLLLLLFFASGT
jgi:hypothetical protein